MSLTANNEIALQFDGRTVAAHEGKTHNSYTSIAHFLILFFTYIYIAISRLLKHACAACFPAVTRLSLHLENHHILYFENQDALCSAVDSGKASSTTLTEFFQHCAEDTWIPQA